jgi:PAS domain S-box-containing protein
VFEQAAVGISLVATDGRVLLANQRLCDITGFTNQELTAKKFQDFTFPADLDADLMLMEQVVLHEINTYTLEKRYVQKSGAVLWVNLSVSVVRRTDGSPEYFISLVEDIDQQKRAQTALLENQAALSDAQRLAGLGNWTWDLISNVTYWSPEMYRIFGRDPQLPSVGYPEVRAYFPQGSWASLNTIVQECVKTGTPYEREIELVLADGSPRWISAHGQAKRNADGGIVGINGTVQDITQRTLDQRKLRLNDLAFKTISQGVLITNASGLIISSNEAFGTITGYCEPDILGKKCNFVQGPLTDPKTINSLRWALDNGAAFTGEIFNYHKSGHGFWNDLAITPVRDGDGKLTHFIGIIRDISERKLAEAALAHHQLNLEALISTRTNELVLVVRSINTVTK